MLLHIHLIANNNVNIRKSYRISVHMEFDGFSIKTQYGKLDGKQRSKYYHFDSVNAAISRIKKILTRRNWKSQISGCPYSPTLIQGEWIEAGIFKKEWISYEPR